MVIGFFAAVVFYIIGVYYHLPFHKNTFLCLPEVDFAFSDFAPIYDAASHLTPYASQNHWGGIYFPFCYLFFYTFSYFSLQHALIVSAKFTAHSAKIDQY